MEQREEARGGVAESRRGDGGLRPLARQIGEGLPGGAPQPYGTQAFTADQRTDCPLIHFFAVISRTFESGRGGVGGGVVAGKGRGGPSEGHVVDRKAVMADEALQQQRPRGVESRRRAEGRGGEVQTAALRRKAEEGREAEGAALRQAAARPEPVGQLERKNKARRGPGN